MNTSHNISDRNKQLVSSPHYQRGLTFIFLLLLYALPHFLYFSSFGVEFLVASAQPLGLLKLLIGETIFTISVVYYLRSNRWRVVAGMAGFFLLAAALYSASLPLSSHYPKIARNLEVGFSIAILGGLAAGIAMLWRNSRRASDDEPINRGWPAAAAPIPLLALAFAIAVFPAELGRALGAGLIVYLAGGVFFVTAGAARRLLGVLHRRNIGPEPRRPVRWIRSASRYLAVAIAIWFVAGLSTRGHEVRRRSPDTMVMPLNVPDAVKRWWKENQGPDGRATMVLIATAGGGIRAAYWTSAVLSKLDQIEGFRKHLFAISSVSGGSLGAGLFRTAIATQSNQTGPCGKDNEFKCFKSLLSNDFLGSLLAGFLFSDALSTFLPFLPLPDRAAAIELSWEAAWRENFGNNLLAADFPTLWEPDHHNPYWPLLLVNATSLQYGDHVLISPISFPSLPGTSSLGITQVMPISTVLNFGARFPILEPPGLLSNLLSPTLTRSKPQFAGYFVDGGYSDNFGAVVLESLLDQIHLVNCQHVAAQIRDQQAATQKRDNCDGDRAYAPAAGEPWIFPIVIQITSDPWMWSPQQNLCTEPPGPVPTPPSEGYFDSVGAPLLTLYNVRTRIGMEAARQLALGGTSYANSIYFNYGITHEFSSNVDDDYQSDPSLNWILSPPSRDSIEAHLSQCEDLRASMLRRAIEDPSSIAQIRADLTRLKQEEGKRRADIMGILGSFLQSALVRIKKDRKDQVDSWQKDVESRLDRSFYFR